MDGEKIYVCPDCGKTCWGDELKYPIASGMLYVCPGCGCIQDEREVERQLGKEN